MDSMKLISLSLFNYISALIRHLFEKTINHYGGSTINRNNLTSIGPLIIPTIDSCPIVGYHLDNCFNYGYNLWTSSDSLIRQDCCSSIILFNCLLPIIESNCDENVYSRFLITSTNYSDHVKQLTPCPEIYPLNCEITLPFYWILAIGLLIVTLIVIIIVITCCLIGAKRKQSESNQQSVRNSFHERSNSFYILTFV